MSLLVRFGVYLFLGPAFIIALALAILILLKLFLDLLFSYFISLFPFFVVFFSSV